MGQGKLQIDDKEKVCKNCKFFQVEKTGTFGTCKSLLIDFNKEVNKSTAEIVVNDYYDELNNPSIVFNELFGCNKFQPV